MEHSKSPINTSKFSCLGDWDQQLVLSLCPWSPVRWDSKSALENKRTINNCDTAFLENLDILFIMDYLYQF